MANRSIPDSDAVKTRFLAQLAAHGIVGIAAEEAGISRDTAYRWREEDEEFARQWEAAQERKTEQLERIFDTLAQGQQKPASNAQLTALIFLLKARRPEVYRDTAPAVINKVELSFTDYLGSAVAGHLTVNQVLPGQKAQRKALTEASQSRCETQEGQEGGS